MTQTITIRLTQPQIALVMRAHPNCNLDRLAELSFEFDQAGQITDCTGTIKDGGSMDHDYAGSGLAHLYERARRQIRNRPASSINQDYVLADETSGKPFQICEAQ